MMKRYIRETKPKVLFNQIKHHFRSAFDYMNFLFPEDFPNREYYLKNFNEIHAALIKNARYILTKLYKEDVEDNFPEEVEAFANINIAECINWDE